MKKYEDNEEVSQLLEEYAPYYASDFSILNKSKKGLRAEAFFDFVSLSGFSNDLLESTFNRSLKTFQNYKNNDTALDPEISEKLLKLFALYTRGITVFGNLSSFSEWLSKPAFGLGNLVPRQIIDTMTGIYLIDEELQRIEFGDLA